MPLLYDHPRMSPLPDDPDALLPLADRQRAARDYLGAAETYRRFLLARPEAWGIRVQQGHCLKEAGQVAEALAAYREAEADAPEDADLQLQIGHALKVMGRWPEAARAYARALALAPGNDDARREAEATAEWMTGPEIEAADRVALGLPPAGLPEEAPEAPLPDPAAQAVVFDVTDLLHYFNAHRTPTGIQRVQLGIVTRALQAAPRGMAISVVVFDLRARCWRTVEARGFLRLCALAAAGADATAPEWTALRDALRRRVNAEPPRRFPRDALLVNLGNSWSMPDYFRALRMARRESGLRYVPFVHDCVPLIVPEHCLADLVRNYVRWFGGVGLHAHGILCNSENTRRDVERHLRALLPAEPMVEPPPAYVVRLDADPRALLPEAPEASLPMLREDEPFALFVATLESRKNHLLVFTAWLQLLRRLGPAAVPRLVCVGKPGWHAEAALGLLRGAPELQRHVLLLHDISDPELDALYRRAQFTVYNSHYEGWGLPITEAFAHGRIVVTPRHSALVEAGGEAALYFTPQSLPELTALLERVMTDAPFRAQQEAVVRQKGRPRSWDAVKDEALDALAALAARPAAPPPRLPLRPGHRYPLARGDGTALHLDPAMAELVREGPGWYPLDDWGVSCAAGLATLRLPLPPGPPAPLRLYLEMQAPRSARPDSRMDVQLRIGTALFRLDLAPEEAATCVFDLPATAGDTLEVEIDSGEGVRALQHGEARLLGLGLRGFMLCRQDDHLARLAFLETQSLSSVIPEPAP